MYHEYFAKTDLFTKYTQKGNKWLFFLAYINPAIKLPSQLGALLLLLIFPDIDQYLSPWLLAGVVVLAIGDLLIHFTLVSLTKWGWYVSIGVLLAHLVVSMAACKIAPSAAVENIVIIPASLVYLFGRRSLFGFHTKEGPPITLSPDDITWGYSFGCRVNDLKGELHLWKETFQANGAFLYGKQCEIPYEQLTVTHSPLLTRWSFFKEGKPMLSEIGLFPLTGWRLKAHLKKKGIFPFSAKQGD